MGELTPKYFDAGRAYLVGIQSYVEVPKLYTPLADVDGIASALAAHEFSEITVLKDCNKTEFEALVSRIKNEVQARDRVLFYFAGHGISRDSGDDPSGFLIPVDAQRKDEKTFIEMRWLIGELMALPCKHLLLILDCCFAGTIRWAENYRALGYDLTKRIYKEKFERFVDDHTKAWQVLTSSSYDEEAIDLLLRLGGRETGRMEDHSPFAGLLIDVLSGNVNAGHPFGDGLITATRLYDYLDKELNDMFRRGGIGHQQNPYYFPLSKSTKGQFIFLLPAMAGTAIGTLPLRSRQNPYKGLLSFQTADSHVFFGRDRAVTALQATFNAAAAGSRVTLVSGASGIGKSSLIMAGLIPICLQQYPATAELTPVRPGNMAASKDYLLYFERKCGALTRPFLLFVDQYEELSTVCTLEQRDQFEAFLMKCLNNPACQLIFSIRSDFEPLFSDSALFRTALQNRFIVPPMQRLEFEEVILQPALQSLIQIESEARNEQGDAAFLSRIVDEAMQSPGSLPLLSFALEEWYERSVKADYNEWILPETHYKGIGGVNGALGSIVEGFTKNLNSVEELAYLKRVLLKMVSVRDGNFARRKIYKRDYTFANGSHIPVSLLERLVALRVVSNNSTELVGMQSYYELAHDSLLTSWKQLWEWINIEGTGKLATYEQLALRTQEWTTSKKDAAKLWDDQEELQLVSHEYVQPEDRSTLWVAIKHWCLFTFTLARHPALEILPGHIFTIDESAFIEASIRKVRRRSAFNNLSIFGISLLSLVAIVFSVITFRQRNAAIKENNRNKALVLSYEATVLRKSDPTQAMDLLIAADSISPGNETVRNNIYSIYAQKETIPFYTQRINSSVNSPRLLLSQDEKYFIAYPEEFRNETKAWQAQLFSTDGQLIANLSYRQQPITAIAFSQDSKKIVIAFKNPDHISGHLTIFNIAGKMEAHLNTERTVDNCVFDPHNGNVISADEYFPFKKGFTRGSRIVTRSPKLNKELSSVVINDIYIREMLFDTISGRLLIVAPSSIRLFNPDLQTLHFPVIYSLGSVSAAFVNGGKAILANSFDKKTVILYDLNGHSIANYFHGSAAAAFDISPGGDTVITGGSDEQIKFWTKKGDSLATVNVGAPVISIKILANNTIIVVTQGAGTKLIDQNKNLISTFDENAKMSAALIGKNQQQLITADGDGIKKWLINYGKPLLTGSAAAFCNNREIWLTTGNWLQIVDSTGIRKANQRLPFPGILITTSAHSDTTFVAIGKPLDVSPERRRRNDILNKYEYAADTGALLSYKDKKFIRSIPFRFFPTQINLDEKGKRMLLLMNDGSLKVYSFAGKLINNVSSSNQYLGAIFTPTGDSVLVVTPNSIVVCNATLHPLKEIKIYNLKDNPNVIISGSGARWLIFYSDDNFLFSETSMSTPRLFTNAVQGKEDDEIIDGSVTPDGRYLFSNTLNEVTFWDINLRNKLYTIPGNISRFSGISKDGKSALIKYHDRFTIFSTPSYVIEGIKKLKLAPLDQAQKNKLGL